MAATRWNRWIASDDESQTALRIWNLNRLWRWSFAAAIPAFIAGALPESGWELVELLLFTILTGTYLCRFAWACVQVDSTGVTYRGILRTRHWSWSDIDGFFSGTNGVGLAHDGRVVWLMPTKRASWSTKRTEQRADALCRRVIGYSPDPDKFAPLEASEPDSNVRRIE